MTSISTFAEEFLPEYAKCEEFVNADLIARGLSPFAPEKKRIAAGRIVKKLIEEYSERGIEFGYETTLSGRTNVHEIERLKRRGYSIHLYFLWLPADEMAITRVAARVQEGGHNVPEADIRRRVVQGVQYMQELYRPIVDELLLFDSSGDEPRGIAWEKQGDLLITDQDTYNQIMRDVQS